MKVVSSYFTLDDIFVGLASIASPHILVETLVVFTLFIVERIKDISILYEIIKWNIVFQETILH
jgi:hypothetical protein